MRLLTRDEINIYKSQPINEKAVDWNNSVLGSISKGIGNAFSWLGGKIAKGWKKMKLNGLVMQYGMEFVKALRAVDLNIEVKKDYMDSDADLADENEPGSDDAKPAQDQAADTTAQPDKTVSDDIKKLVAELEKMILVGFYGENSAFKKHFTNKNMVDLGPMKAGLESFLDSISYDDDAYMAKMNKIVDAFPDPEALDNFAKLQFVIKNLWDSNQDSDLYQRVQKQYPDKLAKLTPTGNEKNTELKEAFNAFVMGLVVKLGKYIYKCNKELESKPEPKADDAATSTTSNTTTTAEKPNADAAKQQLKNALKGMSGKPQSESLVNEAKEFKLPKSVQDLMTPEDMAKFEKMPDIKKKTLEKINTKALATIKYEAEHIIGKAKKKADYDLKSREGSTDADDLQRVWEVGVKNVENHFQKLFDVTQISELVKKDQVPEDVRKKVETTDAITDMIPQMGLTSISPVNAKFTNKGLYAFNVNLRGQNNHIVKEAYLVTSPLADYIDTADDGTKYYWHKVFGQYSADDKGNVTRINPFEKLTRNKSIIDNFKNKENQYFLVFESMRVSKRATNVWVYSNKGSAFYDGKLVPDVSKIIDDVKRNDMQSWLNLGNLFRATINARFTVDATDLKKFPGITTADIVNEQGVNEAKANHELIVNNIQQKSK